MNTSSFCVVIQRPDMITKRFRFDGQVLEYQIFPETQLQNFNETASYAICRTNRNLEGKRIIAFRQGFLEGCDRFSVPVAIAEEPLFAIYGSNERTAQGTFGTFLWDIYEFKTVPDWIAQLQSGVTTAVNQVVEDFLEHPESIQTTERLHEAFSYFGKYCSESRLKDLEKQFHVSDNSSGGFVLTHRELEGNAF